MTYVNSIPFKEKQMSSSENELQLKIAKAKQEYREYAESQKGFCFPKVDITLEENNDFVDVHMEVEFNGTHFHFESLKLEVEEDVYKYLDSDRIVREKFADGKARTREQSKDRAEALSERFQKRSKKGEGKAPNLYSGFAVLDKETDSFIGLGIAGGGTDPGTSEIAFLNRASTWSHMPEAVVQAYDMSSSLKPKSYKGIATAEIGTLLQYGAYL